MIDSTFQILIATGVPLNLQNYMDLEYPDRDFQQNPAGTEEITSMPEWLWNCGIQLDELSRQEFSTIASRWEEEWLGYDTPEEGEDLETLESTRAWIESVSTWGEVLDFADEKGWCITAFESVWKVLGNEGFDTKR